MRADRRSLLHSAAASALASTTLGAAAQPRAGSAPSPAAAPSRVLAPRLKEGDTLGLISPANATYEREPLEIAVESLQALGFKVKLGQHVRGRWGHFGGSDEQRAADVNAMFADDEVDGVIALTGGSGCTRIVDKLNYALIRRKPKFFGGFSDLTCLVNAIHKQTGLVTFHAPVAESEWNEFSLRWFRAIVMEGQTPLLQNPRDRGAGLVQTEGRTRALRAGRARGHLVGGNLTVLSAMAGSPYFPDCRGAILFLEEINEYIYRVDRMLSTLRLCGALDHLAGVVLGQFTNCGPGDGKFGVLTLDEVFDDYFLPLQVPVYRGAMIGHIRRKFTVPVGLPAEMDAEAGTLQLLEPAVR